MSDHKEANLIYFF